MKIKRKPTRLLIRAPSWRLRVNSKPIRGVAFVHKGLRMASHSPTASRSPWSGGIVTRLHTALSGAYFCRMALSPVGTWGQVCAEMQQSNPSTKEDSSPQPTQILAWSCAPASQAGLGPDTKPTHLLLSQMGTQPSC